MSDGTSQDERKETALDAGYIDVDELSLETLLSMSADYGRLLRFYNQKNQPQGDWRPFFESDESVVLSHILTRNLTQFENELTDFLKEMAWGLGTGMGRNLYLYGNEQWRALPNYRLAKIIDDWYQHLQNCPGEGGRRVRQKILLEMQGGLIKDLHRLKHFLEQYAGNIPDLLREDFHHDWFNVGRVASGPSATDAMSVVSQFLRSNFYAFFNAIVALKNSAAKQFPGSLTNQSHSAVAGLYITFAQLYKHAQRRLNHFQSRHLDFYYDEVLKAKPQKQEADSCYLLVQSSAESESVWVDKGTLFSAGLDERGRDRLYQNEHALRINTVKVVSLRTLFFAKDRLSSPENTLGFVTAAKRNELPVSEPLIVQDDEKLPSWPVFGAPKKQVDASRYADASFGFALASATLLLGEGERRLSLSMTMQYRPCGGAEPLSEACTIMDLLDRMVLKSDPSLVLTKAKREDFFFKVFRHMFVIELTTAQGWKKVAEYVPLCQLLDPSIDEDVFRIDFALRPEEEAITPYQSELHGGGYDTVLPILRFSINPRSYLFPYGLLSDFVVTELNLAVDVKGARDVMLYNQLGQLDANTPFNPFGPLAGLGSYLIIGHAEAAKKQVEDFEVELEWGDLPLEAEGFEAHYAAYTTPYANNLFKGTVTALKGGRWMPREGAAQPEVTLFETQECEGDAAQRCNIRPESRLSFSGLREWLQPAPAAMAKEDFVYRSDRRQGFFKLTLSGPETAFGHKDYPQLLTAALTKNALLKTPKRFIPLPKAPYTPLVHRISINYKAKMTLHLTQGTEAPPSEETEHRVNASDQFFHLHPFGQRALSLGADHAPSLLPAYTEAGYLFIGLSGADCGGALSLFFHMKEDATPETGTAPAVFRWAALVHDSWLDLEASQVWADTTGGFLTSGIVSLNLPKEMNERHQIMPDGLFWLRVSVKNHPERLCSLYGIYPHAMKVKRVLPEADAASALAKKPEITDALTIKPLKAGAIQGPLRSIPGISAVIQLLEGQGGRPAEGSASLKIRLSERLKHKNRATTPWDYERLILQQFPEILMVKCFEHTVSEVDQKKRNKPGHLLIAVVPNQSSASEDNENPRVNGAVLQAIRSFVQHKASAFARISVRNPSYEKIQVRCSVLFEQHIQRGYALETLNKALCDYLSPWKKTGFQPGFDWVLRPYEVESFIREQSYIKLVTNFSMLHITAEGQSLYQLADTAQGGSDYGSEEIRPTVPWSIPRSLKTHFIETLDQVETIQAAVTGLDELEIGSTFIVSGQSAYGKKE